MSKIDSKTLALLAIPLFFVIADFAKNVWIPVGHERDILEVEEWSGFNVSTADKVESEVNILFGLKPEVDPEQIKREALAAEEEAKRLAEKEQQKLLIVGRENIRLLGISSRSGNRLAMIRIDLEGVENRLYSLSVGDSFGLASDKANVTVQQINRTSATLLVESEGKEEVEQFNLVIFSYDD